jgi:hypothetical protein
MSTLSPGKTPVVQGRAFEEFCRELQHRLRLVPPNGRLSLEFVTNGDGEIHNHRFIQAEDKGPLSLRLN